VAVTLGTVPPLDAISDVELRERLPDDEHFALGKQTTALP
jgi:hypothetical protein